MARPRQKIRVEQLPDGRMCCYRCKDYKGKSFFSAKEWKKKGYKICNRCRKNDNEAQASKKHGGNVPVNLGYSFRSFSITFKRES